MALTFERGTSSPNASLTWNSNSSSTPGYFGLNSGLIMTGTIASTNGLTLSGFTTDITTGTNEHLSLIPNGTGNVGIGTTSPSQLFQINYSNSNPFVVTSGGNVGIGVTTPNSKLAVAGNGVFGASYGGMTAPSNGLLVEGSVGIGITAPGYKLDVISPSSQIHFGATADNGGWLNSIADTDAVLSAGSQYNGTDWVAKNTTAGQLTISSGLTFAYNTSLTDGSTFTPTQRFNIAAT